MDPENGKTPDVCSAIQLSPVHRQPVMSSNDVPVRPGKSKESEAGENDAPVCGQVGSCVLHDTDRVIEPRML